MASAILVTGAAGRVGAVGRAVTELLLKQGKAVRAMVRNEDERAQALRHMGAEVAVGNLLDLDSMHRLIAGCETMYFGMSVSDAYLAATVNTAAVAKHHGVKAFINMSQMTLSQMSIMETTASRQHKLLARRAGRFAPRGTLRPDVGRRVHANGARAAGHAGVRQEECGDIHGVGKSRLICFSCTQSTSLTCAFFIDPPQLFTWPNQSDQDC
jgi:NAD(P)-dependent dehydrogenase (short-subunit alcohol dehydrogenase family)